MLLRAERPDVDGQLGGTHEVGHEQELPSRELRAVGEVEIFGQRVGRPTAGVLDGLPPPNPRGAVEIEERPRAVARRVLENEMSVEVERLQPREQREVVVEMPPARLDETNLLIL